jgi:transposase
MPQTSEREAQLTEQLCVALEQNAALHHQNQVLLQENKLLREKVDLLVKRIFGSSSEKLSSEQLTLLLSGLEEPKKEPASCASSGALEAELNKKPARRPPAPREREARVPQNLPAVVEIIDPEEVKAEPEKWRQIGQEVTEQLDYEPGRFLRRQLIRRKFVKREANHSPPIIAELNTLQERCIAGVGLLSQIVVSKYCDHLPLYRQEQMFATRYGIEIPRQTMARWMGLAADWLRPIYEEIRITVFEAGYVQIDETPVEYLSPGSGRTGQGYLWACKRPGGDAWFSWKLSRAAACLEQIVPEGFTGTLQCDGYPAYPAFARGREGRIKLAGCLAHARRNFVEAKESATQHACWVLLHIKHLYSIEERLREQRAGPRLRLAIRASEARPILDRIYKGLNKMKEGGAHLPQSAMGKALEYALDQWPKLCLYLEDGRIEIDNNLVENAIRPTALGKKNWLFIGEAGAGERAAIIYTVIESCRRRGIDPYTYLREVFTRLPKMTNHQVKDITPAAWAKSHANGLRRAA